MNRTLIFTATYNEKDTIAGLVERILDISPDFDVLVVDDNSPDGTGELLSQMAEQNSRITTIRRPAKLGLGSAHHLAMLYAMARKYEKLVTMDADFSHLPEEIQRLIDALDDADFIIGSRYMPGGRSDYTGYRRFVSVAANTWARLLLGIPLHEFTTSFRCFRVSALERVNFEKMHNQGYSFFMETVYRLNQAGLRIDEVPITFRDRFAGDSKIPRLEIIRGMAKILHLTASRLMQRKMRAPDSHPLDGCGCCGSRYISVRFPQDYQVKLEGDRASAFMCSSFSHGRKPRVIKCLECGMSQIPPAEVDENLNTHYGEVVDQDYIDNMTAKRRTFNHVYQRISRFLPVSGQMLEVGSYCGVFAERAMQSGWKVKGVEPSKWAAEYSRINIGLDVTVGTLEQVRPSLADDFDAVVTWDVIEHVRAPHLFLAEISSLLKPGGILAFSTIEIDSYFARLMGARWPWIMEMHTFYFGNNVLAHMLHTAGFELLHMESYRHYASLQYIYRKIFSSFSGDASGVPPGTKLVPPIILPVSMGDVRLYVARKAIKSDIQK